MSRTHVISALTALVVMIGAGLLAFGDRGDEDGGDSATQPVLANANSADRSSGKRAKHDRADSGTATPNTRSGASSKSAPKLSEDENNAQANAQRFYDILSQEKGDRNTANFDSAAFCDLMSKEAREQTIDYARRSSGIDQGWTCENSVELLVIRSKRTGGFKQTRQAKIIGINTEGDRATATVRFGKGPLTSIPLVKEEGEWKLGASVAAGQSGG